MAKIEFIHDESVAPGELPHTSNGYQMLALGTVVEIFAGAVLAVEHLHAQSLVPRQD